MGAHIELQAIRALLNEGFSAGVQSGLRRDFFVTIDAQVLYDYLFNFYHDRDRYGHTPDDDLVKERFPEVDIPDKTNYSLRAIVSLLQEESMRRQLTVQLPGILELADVDPVQAMTRIRELHQDVATIDGTQSIDFSEAAFDHISQEMSVIGSTNGIVGIPWKYEPMNRGTGGACPGKFTLVSAPPKTGKTMFCLDQCAHFFGKHYARVAVVVGKEMQGAEVLTILACMLAGVSLEDYWTGQLGDEEKKRFLDFLGKLRAETKMVGMRSKLRIYEDNGDDGIETLEAIYQTYKPDVCYYDALYAATDDLDWKKQSSLITRGVTLANRSKIHTMASWQAHIRESKTSGIEDQGDYAYTQNVYAKPDLSIKLKRPPRKNYMWVGFPAERKLPIAPFKINYNPGADMNISVSQKAEKEDEESLW